MKNKCILFLVFGIVILIVPTIIYLCFLIPTMSEEYIVLMSSAEIIGGGGMYGASVIPDKKKYSGMFKLATNAFTIMTVITLVEKFIMQIMGLVVVFIISFIVFKIFMEMYKNERTRKQNIELAKEIQRNASKDTR